MPILGGGLIRRRGGAWTPVYLLRDEFTSDESAPLASPRTAEPGPGTLTIGDSGTNVSVSSGKINLSGNNTYTSNYAHGAGVARVAGRTVRIVAEQSGSCIAYLGWIDRLPTDRFYYAGRFLFGGLDFSHGNGGSAGTGVTIANNTQYAVSTILRAVGYFLLNGNTLLWVGNAGNEATLYPIANMYSSGQTIRVDSMRVVDLPAPFDSDFGLATQRTASPSAGATATAEANALVEFTWTAATGETLELDVRRTDDDNRWILRCSQAGSTIKLIERNAGVETERASAAQTWTNGTAYRIVAIVDGNVIRTFVANVAKNTYSSASFNNTATGVKVSHAGTDLVCWPRTLSGSALAILEAVSA
jgi:hypothetical protein